MIVLTSKSEKKIPGHLGLGCVAALKEAAGEEILANAAGVVALFSAMTIVVDVPCHHLGFEKVFLHRWTAKKTLWKICNFIYIDINKLLFIQKITRQYEGR